MWTLPDDLSFRDDLLNLGYPCQDLIPSHWNGRPNPSHMKINIVVINAHIYISIHLFNDKKNVIISFS